MYLNKKTGDQKETRQAGKIDPLLHSCVRAVVPEGVGEVVLLAFLSGNCTVMTFRSACNCPDMTLS